MFENLALNLQELNWGTVLFRILFSMLVGGLIGTERDIKQRAAGVRTHMLVSMGAAIIMMTNEYIYYAYPEAGIDISRMGAQVVSGIGFIGAGTILVTSEHRIKGLTTAAGLWAAAAIGLAIGIGFYEIAIVGSIAVLVIFILLRPFKRFIVDKINASEISVIIHSTNGFIDFLKFVSEFNLTIHDLKVEEELMVSDNPNELIFFVTIELDENMEAELLFEKLRLLDSISDIIEVN